MVNDGRGSREHAIVEFGRLHLQYFAEKASQCRLSRVGCSKHDDGVLLFDKLEHDGGRREDEAGLVVTDELFDPVDRAHKAVLASKKFGGGLDSADLGSWTVFH